VCAAVVVAAAVLSLAWTETASTQVVVAPPGWRCYPAKLPKGSPKFVPVGIGFNGTAVQNGTTGQAVKPLLYCDPVSMGGGLNSTSIIEPPLVCYGIKDDSGTPKFPGATVVVNSELFAGRLAIKKSKIFCSPTFLESVGP
jgi:hypothetical protein